MKSLSRISTILAAVSLALVIVSLQFAWNLRSAAYLASVAERANTSTAVASALPDYASKKLPDPEVARRMFEQNVTAKSVDASLQSLYVSVSDAYVGKIDTVSLDLAPIVRPVQAAGYQIPPGTVFAPDTVDIGGLASMLHIMQKTLVPSAILFGLLLGFTVLLGIKRSSLRAVRSVLLVTILILGSLYIATLAVPVVVSSLISSTALDAAMRDILLQFIGVIAKDSGRYYIAWALILMVVAVGLSLLLGLVHRRKRPAKRAKHIPEPTKSIEDF